MEMMFWNVILSFLSALVLWLVRQQWEELQRVQILLNRTREEVAKEYVTKVDVHHDINRVLDRLDRLESKLDTFIREQKSALS
jgi:Na+/H+ antiporter NhaC